VQEAGERFVARAAWDDDAEAGPVLQQRRFLARRDTAREHPVQAQPGHLGQAQAGHV
jgi:hypothetical protein